LMPAKLATPYANNPDERNRAGIEVNALAARIPMLPKTKPNPDRSSHHAFKIIHSRTSFLF
jgi:hypothetical protein